MRKRTEFQVDILSLSIRVKERKRDDNVIFVYIVLKKNILRCAHIDTKRNLCGWEWEKKWEYRTRERTRERERKRLFNIYLLQLQLVNRECQANKITENKNRSSRHIRNSSNGMGSVWRTGKSMKKFSVSVEEKHRWFSRSLKIISFNHVLVLSFS